MNGVSLSTGSTIASPGFITALPIISSPQNKGLQFSEHIPDIARTIQVKAPTMGRRERKLRNYKKRLIRRARRNRASEPCRMYAGVGSFLRIHTNGTVDGEFSKNPGELSIVQFIGLATAIGLVRIKGEVSKNYLCMNKNGILYGHPNMTDECIFKEHQESNHYNYYSSHKYSKKSDRRKGRRKKKGTPKFWFVALNSNGTSRPAHRSRMDQMFTKFLLNRCKKLVVSEPDGPFDITKFTWPPAGGTFQGKIGEGKDTEREEEEKDTGGEKKGKGKKRRCKGKKKGKKCRKGKKKKDTDKKEGDDKEKEEKEKTRDEKDRKKDKSKNENETICKRRWRNRKNRNDYVDETTARKRRQRCKERLRKQRLNDRQAKKEAKSQVDTPVAPTIVTTASVDEVNVVTTKSTTTTVSTTTTTSVSESLPSATEQTESDLKLPSNRFSATNGAATDFRSVFENLIKVIQINNKEMLSNFSSVKGGLHVSLLRSGRHSGQQGGSESIVSGASLGVERKRRHHHGDDDGRRHERALSDSRERAETLSNSDLNMDTQSSETGFKTDLVSDSMNTASKPSVTSRTSPVRREKSSQFELLLKVLNELETQNGRTRPDGSKDDSDSDNFRTGVLIVGNGPRTPSWRQRLRRRHRNKSDSDANAEHLDI